MPELEVKYFRNLSDIPAAHYLIGVMQGKLQYLANLDFYEINEETPIPENYKEIIQNMTSQIPEIKFDILDLEVKTINYFFKWFSTNEVEYLNTYNRYKGELEEKLNDITGNSMSLNDLYSNITKFNLHYKTTLNPFKISALEYFHIQKNYNEEAKQLKIQNDRISNNTKNL